MATPWGRIRAAYLRGDTTYAELAEKYQLSEQTIRNRASKEGWKKEKDEIRTKAVQKVIAREADARARELESIISATDKMSVVLDQMLDHMGATPMEELMKNPQGTASIARAIETIARAKRDLYMLPTWDQQHRAEMDEARRKSDEARAKRDNAKLRIEKERWAQEKKERAAAKAGDGGLEWELTLPEEMKNAEIDA